MACLNTTMLVDLLGRNGRTIQVRAQGKFRELVTREGPRTTTRLNLAELWVGVERSRDRELERERMRRLIRPLTILEFDEESAELFGRITAHQQRLGRPVGDMDALIAAVVVAHGERLVTRNPRDFENVPGLRVETY